MTPGTLYSCALLLTSENTRLVLWSDSGALQFQTYDHPGYVPPNPATSGDTLYVGAYITSGIYLHEVRFYVNKNPAQDAFDA